MKRERRAQLFVDVESLVNSQGEILNDIGRLAVDLIGHIRGLRSHVASTRVARRCEESSDVLPKKAFKTGGSKSPRL